MPEWNATAHRLMDAAETLIKERGFNSFSFRDLQKDVGVKTSTIHYYFATKHDLASSVAERFFAGHKEALSRLDESIESGKDRLSAVTAFFKSNSSKGEVCLGGMLTSDLKTLDEKSGEVLRGFFNQFESWIAATIELGKKQGDFRPDVNAQEWARIFLRRLGGRHDYQSAKVEQDYYPSLLNTLIKHLT